MIRIILYVFTLSIAGIIYAVDTNIPLGVATGALYTIAVLFSWLLEGRNDTFIITLICTVLVIVGYINSPDPVIDNGMPEVNRIISLILIWVCAVLVILAKKGFSGLKKIQETLEEKVEERTKQLIDSQVELKESERLYRYLYEHANEMYVSVEPEDASIIKCNETLCKKLGYTKEELIGEPIFKVYHPDCLDSVKAAFKQFLETGAIEGAELELKTKNGKKMSVILNVTAAKDEEGNILYSRSSWIDVSEYKKTQKALKERSEMLTLKNKELEQFVYIASHDLQEPLRTVTSFSELLNNEYGESFDETGKKSMQFILEATERMRKLILALLHYGQIGKDKVLETVDCEKIVEDLKDDLGTSIENQGAEITVGKLPKKIKGYPTEIGQLFQNLISNAVKFSPSDRSPKIQIFSEQKNGHWHFAVKDNGIGISEEHRERIFKIFQRLHRRKEYEGTGIGLAHCKKIVDLHKGDIWVDSTVGVGSTFYFTIPK